MELSLNVIKHLIHSSTTKLAKKKVYKIPLYSTSDVSLMLG